MTIPAEPIEKLAARLRQATETRVAIPPLGEELAAGGVPAAYAVQQANTDFYIKQQRRLMGRKIGLTSKSVQRQLGVDSPDFGMLFADMAFSDGEEIGSDRLMQPKAEAEVALVLEKDLTQPMVTLAELISAVAYALLSAFAASSPPATRFQSAVPSANCCVRRAVTTCARPISIS